MTIDEAREHLSIRLTDLHISEHTGDTDRIRRAQQAVEHAETVLREVTLIDEGGWRP